MPRVHGRKARVIWEGVDLSCFLTDAGIDMQKPTADGAAFCNGVAEVETGIPSASATITGFYDDAANGPLYTVLPRFAQDLHARVVIESAGHTRGRMSTAFQGPVTQFGRPKQVGQLQTVNSGVAASGEVYEMVNLFNFGQAGSIITNTTGTNKLEVDRTSLPAPYNATTYNGLLYVMVRNTSTAAKVFTVKSGTDTGMVTTPTTHATSPSIAPGETWVAIIGTAASLASVKQFVEFSSDAVAEIGTTIAPYVGLVNPEISMLNR